MMSSGDLVLPARIGAYTHVSSMRVGGVWGAYSNRKMSSMVFYLPVTATHTHTHLWMGDIMFRFIPFGVHNGVTMVSQVHLVPPVHRDAYKHVSGWETSCLVFVLSGVYNGGSRGIPGTPGDTRAIPPLVLGVL